ncbi:MAG: ABC transporter permease [Acidimicrobiales bacterium]
MSRFTRSISGVAAGLAATLAVAFFAVPLAALVVRAPWSSAGKIISEPSVRDALRLSLVCSLSATGVAIVFGTPLAWFLARVSFPGRGLVRTLTTLSMVLPPVVSGVALLLAFGRRGLVGQWLYDAFGIQLPFSTWGVIVAEAFVAMPFLVITLEGAFRSTDRRLEDAAFTLGATRWTTFRRITLPAVGPSLVAGAVLAWARALGEFGATITFAGNFPGTTQTMPLSVYLALETNLDAAILLSLVLVAVSFAILFGLRERWLGALGARS